MQGVGSAVTGVPVQIDFHPNTCYFQNDICVWVNERDDLVVTLNHR